MARARSRLIASPSPTPSIHCAQSAIQLNERLEDLSRACLYDTGASVHDQQPCALNITSTDTRMKPPLGVYVIACLSRLSRNLAQFFTSARTKSVGSIGPLRTPSWTLAAAR